VFRSTVHRVRQDATEATAQNEGFEEVVMGGVVVAGKGVGVHASMKVGKPESRKMGNFGRFNPVWLLLVRFLVAFVCTLT